VQRVQIVAKSDKECRNSKLKTCDLSLINDANDALFTVDLTHGQLEQIFYRTTALRQFDLQMTLPCSYDDYCAQRCHFVTPETLENYRIVDTASKLLERFHSGFKYVTVEYREQTPCGEPVWLQKTVLMAQDTVFDAASGREMPVIHGIILFRDTSIFHAQEQAENQRLQEAFEEADSASKAKTAFMNRMSHDIRTPINGILGMLDILRSNRDDARKVDSCLDKIDLSAHHLLALVNDVLDMSKLEAGQMVMEQEPFDIEVLMHGVSSLVEAQIEKDGLTHHRHRENIQHTALVGSSLKLRQIMVNLFSNAIKYNKLGGAIDTYAKELSCDGTTAWYEFRITDTGIGMSRDFVENQLFKPFTQESADARTQYRGTGLGMSIVKDLVSQMGGSISAESQLGEGTAFTFQLPFLLDKNAAAKPKPKPTDNGRLDGMHILLVEDNDINMEVAEFQLTSQGATVDKAWDGREAVERFAASAPGVYQAILMDVMMPVMDGLEASRAIRALDRPDAATVPILAMTAQASDECAQSCHQVGMNGRLVKPLDTKKLAKSIREAVQNKQ
jgi:two-component system, sensor histidine kinase